MKPIILCVDDDKSVLKSLKQELEFHIGEQYQFETADSGEEALELIEELQAAGYSIPVIISDHLMPGMKGDQLLIEVHQINKDIKKILLTGQADLEAVGRTVNKAQLYRYITKPWEENDLVVTVDEAAKSYMINKRLEKEILNLENINKSALLISEEIDLELLINKILTIALESTHAQKGSIILYESGEQPKLKKSLNYINSEIKEYVSESTLPKKITKKVKNELTPLVHSNIFRDKEFNADEYIIKNKIKSVFCAPIAKQGKLFGLIYLEHSAIKYFEQDKINFLLPLLAQSAVGIEKAFLHEQMESIIEERTNALNESVKYSRMIQTATMHHEEYIHQLFPSSFMINLPKDIVSGDFYWFDEKEKFKIIIIGDCTGHGVPASMISLLGIHILDLIINEKGITHPATILDLLDSRIEKALHINDRDLSDGMEVAICSLDTEHMILHFASAYRPILIYREGKLIEYKGNKFTIGDSILEKRNFDSIEIPVFEGDLVYMFSDGFYSQFGGLRDKKITYDRMKKMIEKNAHLKSIDQEKALIDEFKKWKQKEEQTDDVILLGFKI